MKNIFASIILSTIAATSFAGAFDPKDETYKWVNNIKLSPDCIADYSLPVRTVPVSQSNNITTTVGWWTNSSGAVNVVSSVWDTRHPTDDYHRKYAERMVKACLANIAPVSSQGAFIVTYSANEKATYVTPMVGLLKWPGK